MSRSSGDVLETEDGSTRRLLEHGVFWADVALKLPAEGARTDKGGEPGVPSRARHWRMRLQATRAVLADDHPGSRREPRYTRGTRLASWHKRRTRSLRDKASRARFAQRGGYTAWVDCSGMRLKYLLEAHSRGHEALAGTVSSVTRRRAGRC